MSKAARSRREELTEARDNVQRQIDILEMGSSPNILAPAARVDNGGLIADLTVVLGELNDSLIGLGPDDA